MLLNIFDLVWLIVELLAKLIIKIIQKFKNK
jgi:hypothetical protein